MPLLVEPAGHVTASQIVVETIAPPVARKVKASTIRARNTGGQILIGGDRRIVEGWLTFTASQWHGFTATNWHDFGITRSIGRRAGRTTRSQIVAEQPVPQIDGDYDLLHPDELATLDAAELASLVIGPTSTGRSAASQLVTSTSTAGKTKTTHVTASQIVAEHPAALLA